MTINDYLSQAYAADLKGQLAPEITALKNALADPTLLAEAEARLLELNNLYDTRGPGACYYSTKYRSYLQEALAP